MLSNIMIDVPNAIDTHVKNLENIANNRINEVIRIFFLQSINNRINDYLKTTFFKNKLISFMFVLLLCLKGNVLFSC